jgi:hypothetical protein
VDEYVPLASMSVRRKHMAFGQWLGIVYFNRTPPPEPRAQQDLHSSSARSALELEFERDYEAGAWRKLNRGMTLEETWYIFDYESPHLCIVNSESPPQPIDHIERLLVVTPDDMISIAMEHLLLAGGLPTLVSDGEFGHAIYLTGDNGGGHWFAFHDPWPGRSLLCAENNAAGVKAAPYSGRWRITRAELIRVLISFLVRMEYWAYLQSAHRFTLNSTGADSPRLRRSGQGVGDGPRVASEQKNVTNRKSFWPKSWRKRSQ